MSNEIKGTLSTETNLTGNLQSEEQSLQGTLEGEQQLKGNLVNNGSIEGNLGVEVYVQGSRLSIEQEYKGFLNAFKGDKGDSIQGEKGEPGRDLLEIYKEVSGDMNATEEDLIDYVIESNAKYIRTTPVINSVGGVKAGTVFSDTDATVISVLDQLFFGNQTEEQISYIVYYTTATLDEIQNKNFTKNDFKKIFTDRRSFSIVFEEQGSGYYSLMILPKELFEHNLPRIFNRGFEGGFSAQNISFNGETVIGWRTNHDVTGITVDIK